MLAAADTQTIRVREVCCVDSTVRDLEYNGQLQGGGSWRAGGGENTRGEGGH